MERRADLEEYRNYIRSLEGYITDTIEENGIILYPCDYDGYIGDYCGCADCAFKWTGEPQQYEMFYDEEMGPVNE